MKNLFKLSVGILSIAAVVFILTNKNKVVANKLVTNSTLVVGAGPGGP